jgi:hypothetical protein
VAAFDPLVASGDLAETDLQMPARLAAALAELLPDMARHYAARLVGPRSEPSSLYRRLLPGSRTTLGEARLADLEIALHEIKNQAIELKQLDGWIRAIAKELTIGKTVRETLSLDQLRVLRHLAKPR